MAITTLRPETPAQLVDAVAWALSAGAPLALRGQGSKDGLGRPVPADHVLELSGLSGVVAYEPEELVLTVKGGTAMAEIQALLDGHRQHLAFEPPDLAPLYGRPAGAGTLGGVLACGLAGPRRVAAGSARDHLLGVEGVSGRGEIYKGGAKVVKNVTGYDLPKLMAGSFGTLTALTEVTVKVLPAPEDTRTLLLAGRDEQAAVQAMTRALQSPHEVSGAAHLPEAVAERCGVAAVAALKTGVTAIRLEGFGPSVAARLAALTNELGSDAVLDRAESLALWRAVRDVTPLAAPADHALWKLSVPPAAGAGVIEDVLLRLGDGRYYMDWGGGLLWLAVPPTPDTGAQGAAIRAALALSGGHATLVRAPDAVRAAVDVFQPQPAPLAALAARVKDGFDPRRVLNPGRMYAGV